MGRQWLFTLPFLALFVAAPSFYPGGPDSFEYTTGVSGRSTSLVSGNRWALFLMPDTQMYARSAGDVAAFDPTAAWICDNWDTYTDWTGKAAPIAAVLHLGDIVNDAQTGPQWSRMATAVDPILTCAGGGPPIIFPMGNHDTQTPDYAMSANNYIAWFGQVIYDAAFGIDVVCDTLPCTGGDWFIQTGAIVPANSRTCTYDPPAGTCSPLPNTGPGTETEGREPAIEFTDPDGNLYLVVALEPGMDVADLAGPQALIDSYTAADSDVRVIVVSHNILKETGALDTEDLWGGEVSGEDIHDLLVDPNPEIILAVNGHYAGQVGSEKWFERELLTGTSQGVNVLYVGRNYQGVSNLPTDNSGHGDGWGNIVVFDPGLGTVEIRSVQIGTDGGGGGQIDAWDYQSGVATYTYDWQNR